MPRLLEIAAKYAPPISPESIAACAEEILKENGGEDRQAAWIEAEIKLKKDHVYEFAKQLQKSISPAVQETLAKLIDEVSGYEYELADIIDDFYDQDLIFAENLRFYKNFGDQQILVIEEPPKVRTLFMDLRFNSPYIGSVREGKLEKDSDFSIPLKIALPYVIYVVRTIKHAFNFKYGSMHVLFSNKPVETPNQIVNVSLLPNIMDSGQACGDFATKQDTPVKVARDVITKFWQSQFNYMLFVPDSKIIPTFEEWSYTTKENPLFVLNIAWPTPSLPLKRFLSIGHNNRLQEIILKSRKSYANNIRRIINEF